LRYFYIQNLKIGLVIYYRIEKMKILNSGFCCEK